MDEVGARVAALRTRVEAAARARTGAEYARQQAEQAVAAASAALKQEFGAETPEQALALLADLDSKIAAEVQAAEAALGS